jgi:hypothetical protein
MGDVAFVYFRFPSPVSVFVRKGFRVQLSSQAEERMHYDVKLLSATFRKADLHKARIQISSVQYIKIRSNRL